MSTNTSNAPCPKPPTLPSDNLFNALVELAKAISNLCRVTDDTLRSGIRDDDNAGEEWGKAKKRILQAKSERVRQAMIELLKLGCPLITREWLATRSDIATEIVKLPRLCPAPGEWIVYVTTNIDRDALWRMHREIEAELTILQIQAPDAAGTIPVTQPAQIEPQLRCAPMKKTEIAARILNRLTVKDTRPREVAKMLNECDLRKVGNGKWSILLDSTILDAGTIERLKLPQWPPPPKVR